MLRIGLLVVSTSLLLASFVLADVPRPPEPKRVDPRVRFVGIEKHPGYVFLLTYDVGANTRDPSLRQEQVKNDKEFALDCGGRIVTNTKLLAIAQKDLEKLRSKQPTQLWPDEKSPGVLVALIPAPTATPRLFVRTPVCEYRVAIKDGKLDVKTPWKLRSDAAPQPGWMIGLACAFSLASFGVWFARRRWPREA